MFDNLSNEELSTLGSRYRADYLLDQAGYTLGVAALDGHGINVMLPSGFIGDVNGMVAALGTALQDKTVAAAEAHETTHAQGAVVRDAKLFRRTASRRALLAKRLGKTIPDGLTRVPQADSPHALAIQLVEMTKLLETHRGDIPGEGVDKLIETGKTLAKSLQEIDAKHEVKRLKEAPDAVRKFCEQKGRLYTALKVIHDAGHGLHAGDAPASARYNFSILYRRHGTAKPPAPAPTAEAKK